MATVLTTPRDKFAWSSYFLQALVIGPIFLVFLAVVAVMVRSGIETTTPDVESKSDQTSSSSTDSPLTLLTATVIRVVLAGDVGQRGIDSLQYNLDVRYIGLASRDGLCA